MTPSAARGGPGAGLAATTGIGSLTTSHPGIKRRILFVCHEASVTGAPLVLLQFLRWLRNHTSVEVVLVIGRDGPLVDSFAEVAAATFLYDSAYPENGGLRSVGTGASTAAVATGWRAGPARVAKRLGAKSKPDRETDCLATCDLVYLNTMDAGFALALVPPELPVITHVHELKFQLRIVQRAAPDDIRQILARTDRYLAASEKVAEALTEELGVSDDRICISYEFISPDDGLTDPAIALRARRQLGVGPESTLIASVGAVEWRKGADLFIQVAQRVLNRSDGREDISFVWVGAAEPAWEEAVRHDLEELGLTDRVRFLGPMMDPHPVLAAMDIFALTSRSDPFPLSCLEAAAHRKPIVCFDAGGMSEFLKPAERLVVPYLDVDAMAQRIAELVASPAERARLGNALGVRVRANHQTREGAPRLLRHIEDVLELHRPR